MGIFEIPSPPAFSLERKRRGSASGERFEPLRCKVRAKKGRAAVHYLGKMQPRPAEGMVCKPNSVPSSGGGHCSWIAITGDLQRPTRNLFIRRGRKPHGLLPKRTCWRPSRHTGTALAANRRRADASVPYLVLHPVGFIMPAGVATAAVRSYRTFSPLPSRWVRPHAAA